MVKETRHAASLIAENWDLGFVTEYTLWKYFKDNLGKLGFSKLLEKRKSEGGDFRALWKNQELLVEMEKEWSDYFLHGHHNSEKYRTVDMLICLHNGSYPSQQDFLKLPRMILFIAKRDFAQWIQKIQGDWK
jgi:hypothetical protein